MSTRGSVVAAVAAMWLTAAGAGAQTLPRKAPEFAISTADGKSIPLSQYKGKPLVLAFILTTCSHCQHTVELLSKLQPAYAARGVQMVASAIDQGAEAAVPLFVKNFHPPFPVGYNLDGGAVLDFCGYSRDHLPHMPILLFIDRQGTIRAQHEGSEEKDFFNDRQEDNLRTAIEALAGSGAGKKSAPAKKSE